MRLRCKPLPPDPLCGSSPTYSDSLTLTRGAEGGRRCGSGGTRWASGSQQKLLGSHPPGTVAARARGRGQGGGASEPICQARARRAGHQLPAPVSRPDEPAQRGHRGPARPQRRPLTHRPPGQAGAAGQMEGRRRRGWGREGDRGRGTARAAPGSGGEGRERGPGRGHSEGPRGEEAARTGAILCTKFISHLKKREPSAGGAGSGLGRPRPLPAPPAGGSSGHRARTHGHGHGSGHE